MRKLAEYLLASDDIVVISHINPDGDAVGSAWAMTLALRKLGKRVGMYLSDGIPNKYKFITDENGFDFTPKCALAVDVADPRRMGDGFTIFSSCERRCVLDHHETNGGYGEVCYIEGNRAATGEIALKLIKELGITPDEEMATALYVAIMTDCGDFCYVNTDAHTLMSASECVKYGANASALARRIYHLRSLARTRIIGEAMASAKTIMDGKIAYTFVTEEMLERTGATLEDTNMIVSYMNEVEGALVAVYCEPCEGKAKMSFRSNGLINVAQEIAVHLGGGGHEAASGATVDMPMQDAIKWALELAEKAVKKFENRG